VAVNAVLMTMLTFTAYDTGLPAGRPPHLQQLAAVARAVGLAGVGLHGIGMALAFALVYSLAGGHIIALLTSLPSLQQLADRYLIRHTSSSWLPSRAP
jgi:MATE family multidrug resistance protein